MFQTLKNAWKTQELKTKLLFTLLIVILYRLGSAIPVPWINSAAVASFSASANMAVQMIAGDAFAQATLFALSVSPYITASIIIQLLTVAIPALERLAKDGEEGKKKIAMITRIVTMVLAVITALGYALTIVNTAGFANLGNTNKVFAVAVITACFCAGAAIVMWMAEKINEFGIGNGISIILFANIIARLPQVFVVLGEQIIDNINYVANVSQAAEAIAGLVISIVWAILIIAFLVGIVWLIVWFNDSERRIPVQYAKKVVGRKMYGGQSSNLPLSLNMNGVMPIIFSSSIVSLPATIAMFFPNSGFAQGVEKVFGHTSPLYLILYIALIFAFAFFYVMISFNPVEVANNIKNNGGAIPGIRTGRPTAEYISKVLNRVTLLGALFLAVIAGFPILVNMIVELITKTQVFTAFAFGGSSMLIVVGVALETFRDIEAQMTMRNYKGFLD